MKIIALEGPSNSGKTTFSKRLFELFQQSGKSCYIFPDYFSFSSRLGFNIIPYNTHQIIENIEATLDHLLQLEYLRVIILKEILRDYDFVILDRTHLTLRAHIEAMKNLGFLNDESFTKCNEKINNSLLITNFEILVWFKLNDQILSKRKEIYDDEIFSNTNYNKEFQRGIETNSLNPPTPKTIIVNDFQMLEEIEKEVTLK